MLKTFNFAEWLSEGGNAGMRSFALNLSYEQMCWVRACVNRVAVSASTAPLNFYEGVPGELPTYKDEERIRDKEHLVYKLFNPPKPPAIISLKQLMYRTFIHEQIDGLVFWLIERKKGIAQSIDIRTKNELRPVVEYKSNDPTRAILVGWEDSTSKKYLPEDVLPIGNYDPRNQLSGLSLLTAARTSLESEYAIGGWNSSFFKTGMKSPLLIQAKGQLTKEQKSEIRKEIVNYYSGIDGGHGALVMQGSVEVKPLTVNPKDIDFIRGKELNREEILAVFGVPPALVGIFSYSNYSNVREQIRIFWEHTLLPKMNYILELLQFNILDRDFPGVYAAWDLSKVAGLAPDPVELAAPATAYKNFGYSPSQISRILNCPLLEPDDDFDEDAGKPEEPKEPAAPASDPEEGDPSASDPEKPDNNNSINLRKALTDFAQNCNGLDSRQIMLLWEDFIITQLKELNPEFDSRSVESIPKLLCKDNNYKMVQEFIKQDEKIVKLLLASVYNTSSRV
jgi:HK97 family phage portal protein